MVDTAKVTGRPTLRFQSPEEVLAYAEQLSRAPRIEALGNWILAQAIEHLARSLDVSVDGAKFRVQWYIRLVGPLLKKRILTRPMPSGFRLKNQSAAAMVPEASTTLSDALSHLRSATQRLQQSPHREPHAIFGSFTQEQWDQFHARHAEMHLSFFVPHE